MYGQKEVSERSYGKKRVFFAVKLVSNGYRCVLLLFFLSPMCFGALSWLVLVALCHRYPFAIFFFVVTWVKTANKGFVACALKKKES